jgi:hypothetical protein
MLRVVQSGSVRFHLLARRLRRGQNVADRFVTNILHQQCRVEEEHTEEWEET